MLRNKWKESQKTPESQETKSNRHHKHEHRHKHKHFNKHKYRDEREDTTHVDQPVKDISDKDVNIDYTQEYSKQNIHSSCIPQNIRNIIDVGKERLKEIHKCNMHTYRNPDPQYDNFYTILDDKFKRMSYKSGMPYKSSIHIGQLKLLLSEIRIIEHGLYELWSEGRLSMNGNKFGECDRPVVVIAPGGAAGYHFTQLCKLLPKLTFELIDPNPFDPELVKYPQISTHRKFFTDETAEFYIDKYSKEHVIIIVSDIRSADHRKSSANKVEEDVNRDMKMQDRWFRIINPDFCIYKFRTAYNFTSAKSTGGQPTDSSDPTDSTDSSDQSTLHNINNLYNEIKTLNQYKIYQIIISIHV